MIVRAAQEHVDGIAALLARDAKEQGWPAEIDRRSVSSLIDTSLTFVAVDNGKVIGATSARFVPMYFNDSARFLAALYVSVAPMYRGSGHGAGLIGALEHAADEAGLPLAVQSQPGETDASRIYAKRGYKQVDQTWVRF